VGSGFASKYTAAYTAYGLEDVEFMSDLDQDDIACFFQAPEVLSTLEGGAFPTMHKKRLERAMKALADS